MARNDCDNDFESDNDEYILIDSVRPWRSKTGIFHPGFGKRLRSVSLDVEREWPKLRDDQDLHLFRDLRRGLLTELVQSSQQVLEELLTIYTTCLHYIHQYPHKKEKAHQRCVGKLFKKDMRLFTQSLWQRQLQSLAPFQVGAMPPNDRLLLAISNFISALFMLGLDDPPYKSEPDAGMELNDICITSPVLHICLHSLLFAASNECRRIAYRALEEPMDRDDNSDYAVQLYYETMPDLVAKRQLQKILGSATLDDDCALYVLAQIRPYVQVAKESFGFDLREVVWSRSISILRRQASKASPSMPFADTMLSIDLPNYILRAMFSRSTSSPLVLLEEVVARCDGFKLMASAAILFASTFDYSKLRWNKKPVEELRRFFSEQNVRYRDRNAFYLQMFLLPIIIEKMAEVKAWKFQHRTFISALANLGRPVWENTLVELRAMERMSNLPEFHMIPSAIYGWSELGTLIGVHRLVDSVIGCCFAHCDNFLVSLDRPIRQCSICKNVRYCREECQKKDWKHHKPHCITSN